MIARHTTNGMTLNAPRLDMAHPDSISLHCRSQDKQTQSLPLKRGKESLFWGIKAGGVAIRDSRHDS